MTKSSSPSAPPARTAHPRGGEHPTSGGSYERKPDGALKRVAGTADAANERAPKPPAPETKKEAKD